MSTKAALIARLRQAPLVPPRPARWVYAIMDFAQPDALLGCSYTVATEWVQYNRDRWFAVANMPKALRRGGTINGHHYSFFDLLTRRPILDPPDHPNCWIGTRNDGGRDYRRYSTSEIPWRT